MFCGAGYSMAWGLFSPAECDALIDAAAGAERISMPHRSHPLFRQTMANPKLVARVEQLVEGPVCGLGSDYYSQSAGLATHTDNDYVQALPGTFMSAWIALADVTASNGPLAVGRKIVLCNKGDVVLLDGDTPHRSCAGRGPRPVALFTYIRRGAPFRPGNKQQRAEVEL